MAHRLHTQVLWAKRLVCAGLALDQAPAPGFKNETGGCESCYSLYIAPQSHGVSVHNNNNNHSDKPYLSASAPRLTLWGGGN
jgi:hypothetical protein